MFNLQNPPQPQWIKIKEEKQEKSRQLQVQETSPEKNLQMVRITKAYGMRALGLEAGNGGKEVSQKKGTSNYRRQRTRARLTT